MANIIRHVDRWERYSTAPTLLLQHDDQGWEFREMEYGAGGSWDHFTTRLHVASHLDLIRQRIGPASAPFMPVPPSAAISAPGDHLAGSWEGVGRAQHVLISPGFVAAAVGKDVGADAVARRRFARIRDVDQRDAIIYHLMNTLALEIRGKNPQGSVFLQTLVTALVHHVLENAALAPAGRKKGGLSPRQLRLVLDFIDARLSGRPSLVEFAELLDVSTRYFCRAFRISTGCSPHQFILRRRVELARGLIEAGRMSLSEVAIAAGFVDHAQMTATFRKVLNLSPSHFRNRETPTN
jgi:AraC-like DNA-binding protein